MAKNEPQQTEQESTEIALRQAQELAAFEAQQLEEAGSGFEEATSDSYAVPFLQVLQSGSPQCKKSDGKYIKGAEEGMIFNTVTQELFDGDKGLRIVPCHYAQRMVEWKPRDSGGGFVGEHLVTDPIVNTTYKDDKNRDVLPNGNNLVDTRNHYVLVLGEDGSITPALLAMSSTSIKTSRQWMSKMQGIKIKGPNGFVTAPMHSRVYLLTTSARSNDKGSWFVPDVKLDSILTDKSIYQAAQEFRDAIRAGKVRSSTGEETEADAESSSGDNNEQF